MLPDLLFLVPLGLIGLIRWASWTLRRVPASLYSPYPKGHVERMTVVTPVYQEDPDIFARAVESWLDNHVAEIVAVIDATDVACLRVAQRYPISIIVTNVPGKRDALRRGWEAATTPIVALVDSDTIWADDVAQRVAEPFADPRIGAVATRQNVLNPTTVWQKLNDFYLDYRYFDEVAGQTRWGRAISCASGRTAVYRRELLLDVSEEFMNETFWGVPCNSGDDKRLTMLTLQRGYLTYLQQTARVWSTFPADAAGFFKQRLRWSRNTWRSDLRSLREGWVFRHRWLTFTMLDKALSTFTPLVPPVMFLLTLRHWWAALLLVSWWIISRTVKYLPHFQRRPADLAMVPAVIAVGFALAMTKLWALVTIRQQRWLTRKVAVVDGLIIRSDGRAEGGAWRLGLARKLALGLGLCAAVVTATSAYEVVRAPAAPAGAVSASSAPIEEAAPPLTAPPGAPGGLDGTGLGEVSAGPTVAPDPIIDLPGPFHVRAQPKLPWLGAVGVAYLLAALALETVRRLHARRHPFSGRAPSIVVDPR